MFTEAEFRASARRGFVKANGREPSDEELQAIVETVKSEMRATFAAPPSDRFRASGAAPSHVADEEPDDNFDAPTQAILNEYAQHGPAIGLAAREAARSFHALRATRAVSMTSCGLRRWIECSPQMLAVRGDCSIVGK